MRIRILAYRIAYLPIQIVKKNINYREKTWQWRYFG